MWILARSNRTCGLHRLVLLVRAWNGLWMVRLGLSVRCWVLREHAFAVLLRTTGSAPSSNRPHGCVELGGSVVGGFPGCSLRTTQWMRASLWQVMKSTRWMSWHQEPMKDVGGCEKPRGAANRAVIRGCPNGETRPQSCGVTRA